nr:E3 ubiquitin-protein ligase rnf213-alpha-like [Nerophis lumbriciformis]
MIVKVVDPETGSSVDPDFRVEDMQNPQANNLQSVTPLPQASIRTDMTTPAGTRLTLYFHAIISKDFNFKPQKHRIFIRAGPPLSNWGVNLLELSETRDVGKYGLLVEGKVETQKMVIMSQSIPYKYLVQKKKKTKFEFIYKEHCDQLKTYRCLFVKPHLLNEYGEWHQYDDFLCGEPSKSVGDRFWSAINFRSDQNKENIERKNIAGRLMLGSIFRLLCTWSDINLKNFFIQLDQFFDVYANPSTFEEGYKKWDYYNKSHVRSLCMVLKNFMEENVTPRLQEDGNGGQNLYIHDGLRAAVIVLLVSEKYSIKLDHAHAEQLCTELCLPKDPKDGFLQYWQDFSRDAALFPRRDSGDPALKHQRWISEAIEIRKRGPGTINRDEGAFMLSTTQTSILEDLSMDLLSLIKTVKQHGKPHWIVALPLFHLLEGKDAKPYQVLTSTNGLYGMGGTNSMESKEILQMMQKHSHLMELDPLLVRSGLNLMSLDEIKEYSNTMNVQLLDILRAFAKVAPKEISHGNVEMWNHIIGIHFSIETCQEVWRQNLLLDFEGKYKKEQPLDQINFYRKKIEELDHSLQHVAPSIEKCALEAVSSVCQSKSAEQLFDNFKMTSKFMKLFSALVTGSWPRDQQGNYEDKEEVVLVHLLSWTGAKYIFQLHGAQENLSDKLTSDARERITIAMSTLTEIKNKFMKGNITFKLLNILLASQNAFLDLLRSGLSENERHRDTGKMERLLKCRDDEVKAVNHEREQVDSLLEMIRHLDKHIKVDVTELDKRLSINMDQMNLDEFMEVHLYEQFSSKTAGAVTYFGMNKDIKQMSEDLNKFKDSHLFIFCWKEESKRLYRDDDTNEEDDQTREQFTLCDLYEKIFTPCVENYTEIYTRLKNGTIKLEEVTQLFGDFKGKYAELDQDLNIMCRVDTSTDKQWIHARLQQIEQYHELHLAVASAKVIMEVKETLGLEGDFSALETLLKVSHPDFQGMELQCIDNNVVKAKSDLMDITDSRRGCLKELTLSRHFVKWVKDALQDLKDLKVFVDLASISAGENDMEVDRVLCFHDAVLGYSSVLYDLRPDSGFLAFQDVLKMLWKAFDNDKNLPQKLRDSGRHLEWLKTVKDSHGSVELSSMSLASAINRKGIYRISAYSGKKLSLDTALKLEIMEEDKEARRQTLEDVRELQNKLMLMSGKGDQGQKEVNYFAEVFAGVQRLSEAFIALHTAGNPLFRHWEAQIHCCYHNKLRIVMNFNLGNEITMEDCLPELCVKMENCLNLWMDFVDKRRSQYYYLNYFTAEQIVYLCINLSEEHIKHVDNQVLMMLSFIKSHCTAEDVLRVWRKLQNEILTQPQEENEEIEFQGTSDPRMEKEPQQEANTFQMFDLIWNNYMEDPKKVLPQILDIKSLGRLLELLALSEENHANLIKRELPKRMAAGTPNLLVCPHAAVLTSCISIYMTSKHQPLPTYDEVLLCNSSTTYEQAELFLRRCLGAGGKDEKIYCLLHGELLTYDVSSKFEKFFQRMKMQCMTDYRLVILCSSEREHAYLPSAFSQYRLQIVPQMPLDGIRKYLHQHYVVPAEQCSAAAVFKDRLCIGTVTSERAGVGKSLYIQRLYETLKHSNGERATMNCIRLIEPSVNETAILQSLMSSAKKDKLSVFHFDITSSVKKGIHEFLFKLLILRYLMDSDGNTWKCDAKQLYVMEFLQQTVKPSRKASAYSSISSFTDVFPNILCRTPKEVLCLLTTTKHDADDNPLMDDKVFKSEAFQRPYQYLKRFHHQDSLDRYSYTVSGAGGSHAECLQMLFIYCGILDPSWAELRNFTWFLNLQLKDSETSVFCDAALTGDILNGFKKFVVGFMIVMAKDFATPSLSISDQSLGNVPDRTDLEENDLADFLIRKEWEKEPHPYIFFNEDHSSMTFIGFNLQRNSKHAYDAIDPKTKRMIKENVMSQELFEGLRRQGVPFNIDFDTLPRREKIQHLCHVLGIKKPFDPDPTYELTTDNILKMLAIHMRFRCGIPVIIMGETGCGKTRLIKYLCELRRSGVATENMKLLKVHGGTSSEMIYAKVREAEAMAFANKRQHGFDSVLFLDEANTTEDISSIKEVLCDKTVKGVRLVADTGLQIIAACNPYRKHTDKMIERLESAGLGYRVRSEETDEKLGSIPLRQLVYRVQALPPSMIPLVWDFGQLNDTTEEIYIHQIVKRVAESLSIPKNHFEWITRALSASQKYMRERRDECSFVSLRDVERCMQAFLWFHDKHDRFFAELKEFSANQNGQKCSHQNSQSERDPVMWSLIMALGVCYHACLEQKDKYRQCVSKSLPGYSPEKIKREIILMQDLLLSGVPMADTIARNAALKENVFMMVICIELKIPLFLVGKPGTSKSLSKTLVADAMQGQAAHSDLFKMFKQVHLVSFQCSPHSTPEGIINIFKQCGRFQERKNLNEYISVVVLDEIGLAEDSPKMPLKTLHPLLEEGCIDDEQSQHKKVGFIGISNWALDPAKMNRGIFVSRGDPDKSELIESAQGICSSDVMVSGKVEALFSHFAVGYIEIVHNQGNGFFGLRDYYSLIKMVYAAAKASTKKPTANEVTKAILRNFSGKDDVDAVTVFTKFFPFAPDLENISTIEFVRANIQGIGKEEDCRYLLVLTRNYAALQILQQTFFADIGQPEIIFGSSFPKDQEYTQICRNINRVKICMETGQTVVLLNLQNLYESLYDALNQYYVYLGGQKYVDLGLGTHRVKCRVHNDFRLIVIEEREVVYKQFPIPLINRLEKHYLDIHTVLTTEQRRLVEELEEWVKVVSVGNLRYKYRPSDVFIGYHSDACASVIHQVIEKTKDAMEISDGFHRVVDEAKHVLLRCATPDSVVRLSNTDLPSGESGDLAQVYFEELSNSCIADFIDTRTRREVHSVNSFTEVTTFSRLLIAPDLEPLQRMLPCVELLSLQQFDTEHFFLKEIRNFLTAGPEDKVLIIQSEFKEASRSAHLIASAKYSAVNEVTKLVQEGLTCRVFIYFITRLPRIQGGTSYAGFHGEPWTSVHIDDLRRPKDITKGVRALLHTPICQLFETNKPEALDASEMGDSQVGNEEEADVRDDYEEDDSALDTTALVQSCAQSAVGMLRDEQGHGSRSTERLETVLLLLGNSDQITCDFLQIVKKRLYLMLSNENHLSSAEKDWAVKVASSIDALQEGGTFCHALWKRIQAVVTPILAQLLSVIDADRNLDLLKRDCSVSVRKLWLHIFADDKLLEIPLPSLESETRTILVKNQGKNFTLSMPFSWRIKDYLEEHWVHVLQNEGHTQQRFIEFFSKTPLGQYISEEGPEVQSEFFQFYLRDFLILTMNVSRQEDLELLCIALNSCVDELRSQLDAADEVLSLPWVHAAYHQFKNRMQNLSRMVCLEPWVTGKLISADFKLVDKILRKELELQQSVFWTDSTAVLKYLNSECMRFKTFVANRVTAILERSQTSQWKYINTALNPTDYVSRGQTVEVFLKNEYWISGPKYLIKPPDQWPRNPDPAMMDVDDLEVKGVTQVNIIQAQEAEERMDQWMNHYSSWTALKHAVAWFLKLKTFLKALAEKRKELRALGEESKMSAFKKAEHVLDEDGLRALLCEAEAIVNSRPITRASSDVNDLEALTPSHPLLLEVKPDLPQGLFHGEDQYAHRRWRHFSVGDVVLIVDDTSPRHSWPLRRIVETFPARDGLVHQVRVETKTSKFVDVYAALFCLDHLGTDLGTDSQKQDWVRRVNKLKIPIELVCSENSVGWYKDRSKRLVNEVRSQWNRLFSLSLFAEHFKTQHKEMMDLILEHMRQLDEDLKKNSDLKTQQPFEEMIRLLKNCKDDAVRRIFRFTSLPWCSLCRGHPQDPVCLPCEHIFCASCVKKHLVPCQMYCPQCKHEVPEDFDPVASEDLRTRVEHYASFRNQCNAFFIDLVSSVCFKDNSPPCPAVIQHLLSFLLVEPTTTLILNAIFHVLAATTKVLSPFDDSADKNPVVRSVMLKLLLKYSFEDVKDYLQHHLKDHLLAVERCQTLEEKDKTKLYCLYLKCLQDSMFESFQVRSNTEKQMCMLGETDFLMKLSSGISMAGVEVTVEHLQQVARVRMDLDLAATIITTEEPDEGDSSQNNDFLESVQNLCSLSGENWYRVYLLRKIISQRGGEFVLELLQLDDKDWLFPKEILEKYVSFQRVDILLNFIDNSKVLAHPKVKAFARVLVNNRPGALEVGPQTSGEDCASVALAVHLAAVLLCTYENVVTPLRCLATEPDTMQATYLPTMPQDKLAEAQQALGSLERLQWYKCPNGHPCSVGECGLPTETTRCPDCNAPIGGNDHKAVKDFKTMEKPADRTQTGYILGDPDRRDNADMLDTKHLSPVHFTLIRMLTHLAMLIGVSDHPQNIASIISPPVSEPGPFLLAHLKKDKEHLRRYLGKGTDDVVGSVHLLIRALLKAQRPQSSESWTLSTNAERNEWETQMSLFIEPELRHLDGQLEERNKSIQTDSENSDNPIMWLLHDDPASFMASLKTDSCLQCSAVWSCEENVSLQHLTNVVDLNDGSDTLPVLWKFLNKEAKLRLVKHLPDIVSLQKALLKQFLNVTQVSYGTIAQFLNSQTAISAVSLRTWYEKHIKIFLTTWNQLRSSLETYDEIKVPSEFCQRDLDTDSDLKVLLPQRHGPGLCSLALVSYLIGLHNDLVRCVNNHPGEETSYKVSPENLTDLHVIHYDPEKDMMPLLLANTQYCVERDQETFHEYDLPRIQKQIVSRFLLGKPIIQLEGILTLVNRPDRDYNIILKDVKEKVKQEPLTTQTMAAIAEELHNFSELCEALSALEVALGFLHMGGQDPNMRLSDYLRDVLQMGNQISDNIFKVLSWCYLKHCVVLWQLLTALKSETMLKLNRDPFEKVCKEYKRELCEEQRHPLTAFFSRNSTEIFLLELHELLWLVLKNPTAPDLHKPHWSLIWSLDPAEEDKYPGFPKEEICLCHAVETWKFVNAIKHERIHRLTE